MAPVYLLYAVSGFISLGYQVVWYRTFVDHFGSTNLTFILVLCNFIGGLGAGALASRRIAACLRRFLGWSELLRVYGLVELLVTLAASATLLLPVLPVALWGDSPYRLASDGILRVVPSLQVFQVVIAALVVFVPCFFMGVTFPLLCDRFRRDGRFPSAIYGWNTLGACAGVLTSEFVLLPTLGHGRTFWLLLLVNALLGAFFLRWARATGAATGSAGKPALSNTVLPAGLLIFGVLSGLLAGILEGDLFKRLQFLGCTSNGTAMSFISFWAILGIFLASWTVRALPKLSLTLIRVSWALAWVYYAILWAYSLEIREWLAMRDLDRLLQGAMRASPGEQLEMGQYHYFQTGLGMLLLFTGLFVFPVMYCISLLLPHVLNRFQVAGRHLGLVYGANTVAFCLGIVAFTWAAPRVNLFYSLKLGLTVFLILALLLVVLRLDGSGARRRLVAAALACAAAVALTPADFDTSFFAADRPPANDPVRGLKSNGAHTTYVVEDPHGDSLYFEAYSMSSVAPPGQQYMRLMAHFPLLAHPAPRRALLVCFGVGSTASAIARHAEIETLDIVDLNRNVFETADEFVTNGGVIHDPRVSLFLDDGRNFLNTTDTRYDLITSEPPPPMHEGVYRLYSREYYRSVLDHLTPNGLMTQWLTILQMPPEAVQMAMRTFTETFPHTLLFVGYGWELILVGSPSEIDLQNLERRFNASESVREDLERIGVPSSVHLLSRIIQGDGTLREESRGAGLIRDQSNDLAHLALNPLRTARISFDPVNVLEEIQVESLSGGERLRQVVMDLALLREFVPDIPTSILNTVPSDSGVRYAGVDWKIVHRLNTEAEALIAEGRLEEAAARLGQSIGLVEDQSAPLRQLATLQERAGNLDYALAA
jgi:spermidine synthase